MFNQYQPYSPYTPSYMQRPYSPQPQQIPQPQPQVQPQMPMTQQVQPQSPISQAPQIQEVRHGTEDEIKGHIVYPNCVVYFIDYPQNRLYAKTANASGISNIQYFSITPINADGSPIKPQEPTPQVNFEEFIKKEDLEKLGFVTVEQFKALADSFEQMKKRLEGVKSNVGQPKQSAETRV